jgi:hypothetical protein
MLRDVESRASSNVSEFDQEAGLFGRWTPRSSGYVMAGGGLRTVHTDLGASQLLRYLTALASAQGRVRPGWTMNGVLSHTTTADPLRGTYGLQMLSGTSRMSFGRLTVLDLGLQVSTNGDSSATRQRWANSWTSRLQCNPLRSLQLVLGLRSQRIGPGLLRPELVTSSYSVDGTWRPVRRMDVVGTFTSTTTPVLPGRRIQTWTGTTRIQPVDRWQFQGTWSHAAQPVIVRGVQLVAQQDVTTGRLVYQPARRLAASASLSVVDPARVDEIRRGDVILTWSFGR